MMNAQPHENLVSEDEFWALVESSEEKLELHNGRVVLLHREPEVVTDDRYLHARLSVRLSTLTETALTGKRCTALGNAFYVEVESTGDKVLPDNVIHCDEPRLGSSGLTLLNPVVVFEVLSPSTEKYDRTQKFDLYKKIEPLSDYVLISMDFVRVEHFSRQSNGWLLQTFTRLDETLELPSVDLTIAVSELYDELDVPVQLSLLRLDPELETT